MPCHRLPLPLHSLPGRGREGEVEGEGEGGLSTFDDDFDENETRRGRLIQIVYYCVIACLHFMS